MIGLNSFQDYGIYTDDSWRRVNDLFWYEYVKIFVLDPTASISSNLEILQIHSKNYRNPQQLPSGAVMVVGSGSSGSQIADELSRTGRQVFLSIGPHDRPPRRYRGYDYVWWLGVLGKWQEKTPDPKTEHVTIAVSGSHGGQTVDFRRFAQRGMILIGLTKKFEDGLLYFANDLKENISRGDKNYLSILDRADDYVAKTIKYKKCNWS